VTLPRFSNRAINADSITTSNERRLVSFNRQEEYIRELELEQGPYRTSVANIGSRKHAFTRLLLMHLERTSAHALPRVARTRSLCRRLLWLGTFAFFVGYFIYQLVSLLTMFYSYPVGATILIEQQYVKYVISFLLFAKEHILCSACSNNCQRQC
jgi:Amiloride-sensitive sodium channel